MTIKGMLVAFIFLLITFLFLGGGIFFAINWYAIWNETTFWARDNPPVVSVYVAIPMTFVCFIMSFFCFLLTLDVR